MASSSSLLEDLTNEQTTALATDLMYIFDSTEPVSSDGDKKLTLANLATLINATAPRITNVDGNTYVQWESGSAGTVWTIRRLSDGFLATITNNPTMTTAALAWTNRATLTYSVDGT